MYNLNGNGKGFSASLHFLSTFLIEYALIRSELLIIEIIISYMLLMQPEIIHILLMTFDKF